MTQSGHLRATKKSSERRREAKCLKGRERCVVLPRGPADRGAYQVQMTFFFFLPNFLLSGFAFPFRGMPQCAQVIGETLPLTHFIRIVRGITLKGTGFADMQTDAVGSQLSN
jgi:hypothetical protein